MQKSSLRAYHPILFLGAIFVALALAFTGGHGLSDAPLARAGVEPEAVQWVKEPPETTMFITTGSETITFDEVLYNQTDPNGLGAFAITIAYQAIVWQTPVIDLSPATALFAASGRALECSITLPGSGQLHIACASTGELYVGPVWSGPEVMARVTLALQPSFADLLLKSGSDAGHTSTVYNLFPDEANTCGQPLNDGSEPPLGDDGSRCQGNLLPTEQPGWIEITIRPSATPTPTPTAIDTETPTVTATATMSPAPSPSPSATGTATLTTTPTPSPTTTGTTVPTATATEPTATSTAVTATATHTPTNTATPTATAGLTSTPTPSSTATETSTATPTRTPTGVPTATKTPSSTPTVTNTPVATATHTSSPTTTPSIDFHGCTPGFWQNNFAPWSATQYWPSDKFELVFDRDAFPGDPSLLRVLKFGGGGLEALSRHAVAALLNASHPDIHARETVDTPAKVIALWQAAYDSGDEVMVEQTKDLFEAANESQCSVDAHGRVNAETPIAEKATPTPKGGDAATLPPPCLADVNGDGAVNLVDLSLVGSHFHLKEGSLGWDPLADLNSDKVVNVWDMVIVARAFGKHCR